MADEARTSGGSSHSERWLVLVGALMVQLILGTVYGFSKLVEFYKREFPEWSATQIQLIFTLALVTFAIVMVPAGRLQDKKGPRLPALLGAAVLFCGIMLASLVRDASQLWLMWLSYGVLFGAGIGLAYVCPIAALAKWFPDIKGLITGIAVAGFGGAGFIFAPTVKSYLAVEHTLPDFFRLHALISGVVVAIGASLLKNPPEGYQVAVKPGAAAAKPAVQDVDAKAMVRTVQFWQLWGMFVCSAMAGLMTIGVLAKAIEDVPTVAAVSAAAVGMLAIFNAAGRIFWGAVSDRLGRTRSMTIMFAAQAVAMFLFIPGLQMGATAVFVLSALIGLNFGGNFALFPSATADAFGAKNLGVNYGCVFTAYGVGGTVGPLIAGYFKDSVGEFGPAFMIAGVLVALAAVAAALYGKAPARPHEQPTE